MKKLLGILVLGLLLSGNALGQTEKEFNNWLNSFDLSKLIVQDKIFGAGQGNRTLYLIVGNDSLYQ